MPGLHDEQRAWQSYSSMRTAHPRPRGPGYLQPPVVRCAGRPAAAEWLQHSPMTMGPAPRIMILLIWRLQAGGEREREGVLSCMPRGLGLWPGGCQWLPPALPPRPPTHFFRSSRFLTVLALGESQARKSTAAPLVVVFSGAATASIRTTVRWVRFPDGRARLSRLLSGAVGHSCCCSSRPEACTCRRADAIIWARGKGAANDRPPLQLVCVFLPRRHASIAWLSSITTIITQPST